MKLISVCLWSWRRFYVHVPKFEKDVGPSKIVMYRGITQVIKGGGGNVKLDLSNSSGAFGI